MRDILPSLKQDTSDGLEGRMEWPSLRKGWVRRLQPFAKQSEELNATSLAAQDRTNSAYVLATGGNGWSQCLPLSRRIFGIFPKLAEVGDRGFAFLGAQVLYTLRPRGPSSGRHISIGETYIHGVMDRGLMRSEKIGTARVENLVLV
jgi:hypothetical protein